MTGGIITQKGSKIGEKKENENDMNIKGYEKLIYFLGVLFRLIIYYYGLWQDSNLNVKFTDIDYYVFTDAAKYVLKNKSPYMRYGHEFVYESFIYHLVRRDHRHNFSLFFYIMYLSIEQNSKIIPLITFLPQIILVCLFGFKYAKSNLDLSMFLQTVAFIALNKVCTSQCYLPDHYFVVLPLVYPIFASYPMFHNSKQGETNKKGKICTKLPLCCSEKVRKRANMSIP
ncbi:GPI mannosyltransferase I, putative (PIGM) [Plasmodium ovale curtisi]|uniref:GPI mannosyltransferase 1 n=1 Tax=Plasmodium ovale curtisi TaxID=864141 RepID=A0A1A8W2H3_PLAOA|nr:GPI mannosyltransferase I, putative (PIGM) [Plasmodium ovale curtisi]SBS97384.1 GPI mannosyltransferase I, putative (PIGM) [Plasmodium ovale curtisi]